MKKSSACKILFVAQDPGGFNAIFPVIKALRNMSAYRLKFLMAKNAVGLSRAAKIRPIDASEFAGDAVEKKIVAFAPRVIVTGTSGGACIEKTVTTIAKKMGIPAVAVLDFWINYRARFNDLPDYILVMDETAKEEMIAEGFPASILVITGNPHFDTFKKISAPRKSAKRIVAFIDQPFAYAISAGWGTNYGFDEHVALRDLLDVLRGMRFGGEVLIQLHPKTTDPKKFNTIIKNAGVHVRVARKHEDVLKIAHIIFGMTSPLLIAAAVGGKPAVSYEPGLLKSDPLASNRWGLTIAPRTKDELRETLLGLIAHPRPLKDSKKIVRQHIIPHATQHVLNFIKRIAKV